MSKNYYGCGIYFFAYIISIDVVGVFLAASPNKYLRMTSFFVFLILTYLLILNPGLKRLLQTKDNQVPEASLPQKEEDGS